MCGTRDSTRTDPPAFVIRDGRTHIWRYMGARPANPRPPDNRRCRFVSPGIIRHPAGAEAGLSSLPTTLDFGSRVRCGRQNAIRRRRRLGPLPDPSNMSPRPTGASATFVRPEVAGLGRLVLALPGRKSHASLCRPQSARRPDDSNTPLPTSPDSARTSLGPGGHNPGTRAL